MFREYAFNFFALVEEQLRHARSHSTFFAYPAEHIGKIGERRLLGSGVPLVVAIGGAFDGHTILPEMRVLAIIRANRRKGLSRRLEGQELDTMLGGPDGRHS